MIKRLNFAWRFLATAVSFLFFGVGGLCLTLFIFPLINLFCKTDDSRRRRARKLIHKSFKFFIEMMSFFGMFNFDVYRDKRRFKDVSGKIIVANHPTLIDVVVLIATFPQADCIVKKSLWANPFLRGVVKAAGYIRNDQNVEALMQACQKSLDAGYSVIIFPEGTRTNKNGCFELLRGASNIALRCNSDLVPVLIQCNPSTLSKGEPWYKIPPKKVDFLLRVGEDISITAFQVENLSMSIRARRLTQYLKEYFIGEQKLYART